MEKSPEDIDRMQVVAFLKGFLSSEFAIEGEARSISVNASGSGYSAAIELHPDEARIYICGKENGGSEFEAWISTTDGTCSENFDEILEIVFPD